MGKLLKKLNFGPLGSVETRIGKLTIFPPSLNDQRALDKSLPNTLEKTTPEDFVRAFIRFVCFPGESLKEGKYKPSSPVLTDEALSQMTTEDLDNFAKGYIEGQPYLVRETEFEKTTAANGKSVHTAKYGEIKHPKAPNESYISYLHRLTLLEREEQRESLKRIVQPLTSFSSGLVERMKRQMDLGERLTHGFARLPSEITDATVVPDTRPTIDWAEHQRAAVEAREAPFRSLSERLDQLIDSSLEASTFMVEANELQAQIAEEVKRSGDSASLFSKWTLWLSIAILVLTAVGIGVASYSQYLSSKQAQLSNEFNASAIRSLDGSVARFSDAIRQGNSESRDVLNQQLNALVRAASTLERLERGQVELEVRLHALAEENAQLRLDVVELQRRLENADVEVD